MKKKFIAYFWFVGWEAISCGLHIDVSLPNIEIHLPFGFIRIGWVKISTEPFNYSKMKWRCFGLDEY